jgi:hypothetical protein
MTTGEQAELIVNLRLRDQFTAPVKKLQANLQTLDRQTAQLQRGLGKVGQGLKTGIGNAAKIAAVGVGFLALQLRAGIQELIEWEDAQLQVNAAIKSTGGVAGVTAKQVEGLADKYADLSLVEDDVILGAQAILLRFPKVTKDVFEPALKASLDLSQAMGTDLTSATRMVARALDDPISGISKLTRAGITFTEEEKKKIARLQETGRTLDAQNLILRKLERRFGGSAQNATRGFRGQVKLLNDRVKDLQATFAGPLLPAITTMVSELIKFAEKPEIVQQVKDFGAALAGFVTQENIQTGFDAIKSGFGFIRDLPWDTIKSGLQTTADVAKKAVDLFKSLPPELQTGLVTLLAANKLTGGLVASGLGDIAQFLLRNLTTINATVVNVIGAKVNTPGGGLDVPGAPGAGPSATSIGLRGLPIIGFLLGETERVNARLDQLQVLENRANFTGRPYNMGRYGPSTRPGSFGTPLSLGITEAEDLKKAAERLGLLLDESRTSGKGIQNRLATLKVQLLNGQVTAKEANKKLTAIDAQIERQKVNVSLQANVNISAVATGNAVTFGSGTNRIIVPT